MASLQLLTFLCFFFPTILSSVSGSIVLKPHAAESFNVSLIQNLGSCRYTVIITTSCYSPRYTRDQISLVFGDGYGNQILSGFGLVDFEHVPIYAPRLDNPGSRAFEQCSSDTYEVNGPCAYQICYVYLYRSGPDGWIPGSVKIFSQSSRAVTFQYNTFVPESLWYGFNYCNSVSVSRSNSLAFGLGKLILVVLATLLW